MREREVKLAAPPTFRMADLADLADLADGLVAVPGEPLRFQTVYFDTADLRLVRWGCSLRHRSGEGWTAKLPAELDGPVLVRGEHLFGGEPDRPPEEALDLLRAYVRGAPLAPVARLRTVRRPVALLAGDGERLGEIVDDEVSVIDRGRLAARFREVEVEAAAGMSGELLDAVVERLRAVGAGAPDPTPKYVRALGPRALAPAEVVAGGAGDRGAPATVGDALRAALARSVVRLIRHDPGVALGEDPEDVHQARVATRRLRSDLRTFRSILEPEWTAALREELRWLGARLGAVRDSEVLLERLRARSAGLPSTDRVAADALFAELAGARDAAREALLAARRDQRFDRLLDRLVEAAVAPPLAPEAGRPAAGSLGEVLARPLAHLRRAVRDLGEEPPDDELHRVRILAKRCRYAAEDAAPALGGRAARLAAAAAGLQDVLGEHHDAVVAEAWLRERADRACTEEAEPAAAARLAFVTGELAGLELEAARAARAAWPAAWHELSRRKVSGWL